MAVAAGCRPRGRLAGFAAPGCDHQGVVGDEGWVAQQPLSGLEVDGGDQAGIHQGGPDLVGVGLLQDRFW